MTTSPLPRIPRPKPPLRLLAAFRKKPRNRARFAEISGPILTPDVFRNENIDARSDLRESASSWSSNLPSPRLGTGVHPTERLAPRSSSCYSNELNKCIDDQTSVAPGSTRGSKGKDVLWETVPRRVKQQLLVNCNDHRIVDINVNEVYLHVQVSTIRAENSVSQKFQFSDYAIHIDDHEPILLNAKDLDLRLYVRGL